jgi:hypothetical protein
VCNTRAQIGVGAPRIRRVDTSRDVGKFSYHERLVSDLLRCFEMCGLYLVCPGQTLPTSVRRRAHAESEIHVKWPQLEMQLVVTHVAAVAAVASEASKRMTLEAAKQSTEDRATAA